MKYGYNDKDEVVDEDVTFTVKCTMRKRWAAQFVSMLDYMEYLGGVGSSRRVTFYSDGDGDFHPKFEFDSNIPKIEPSSEKNGDVFYDAG